MIRIIASLISLCFSFPSVANIYTVELKNKNVSKIQNIAGIEKIEKFTDYKSEYFERLYTIQTNSNFDLKSFKTNSQVVLVEKDFQASYFEIRINKNSEMVTNDLLFPQQWGLYNQGQTIVKRNLRGKKITIKGKKVEFDGTEVQLNGTTGTDINWKNSIDEVESKLKKVPVVAVIDMGIDLKHPELQDAIYKNENECDTDLTVRTELVDRDSNGLPSDCHGWNFAATEREHLQYPFDDKGHGTHISGIIAAKRNDGIGISGVSDKIKILPVRVTGRVDETADKNNLLMRSPSKRIANGILYAVKMGVDVINLSLGWPKSMDTVYMRNVIREALDKNITVVAAAGNDNSSASIYPCNYHDVICVGSIDADGSVSSFSNFGGQVDILAPGDQIVSTFPAEFIPLKLNIQGYDIFSGTSQAAPFVSATAALLKGVYPEISNDEVKRRLLKSARTKVNHKKSSFGLLNFAGSFQEEKLESFITPVFKEVNQALVNPENGIFQFPIFLKNLGEDTVDYSSTILSKSDSIEILNIEQNEKLLKAGTPNLLFVTGRVKNFSADHKFELEIQVQENGKTNFFSHPITLGMNITKVPKYSFGFKFEGKAKPLIVKDPKTNKFNDILNTVDEKYEDGELPSYYVLQSSKNKDEKSINIYLFNFDGRGFKESKNNLKIENALKFLSIDKHDYNYDGKKDFLIKTISCRADCSRKDIPESDLFIKYSYRTSDLEPLFGDYSDLGLTGNEGITEVPKTTKYYKLKLPNGQILAAPYFISTGKVPSANQESDDVLPSSEMKLPNDSSLLGNDLMNMFKPKDRSLRRRIYRLDLEPNTKNMRVRSFVHDDFYNLTKKVMLKILNQRIAIEDTHTSVVQLLSQSKEDFYANKINALLSFGLGSYQYNILLEIKDDKYTLKPRTDITDTLLGNSLYKYFKLDSGLETHGQDALVNFSTAAIMTVNALEINGRSKVIPFQLEKEDDLIMSFIGLFESSGRLEAYIENVDTIGIITNEGGKNKLTSSPISKFSFLPGQIMSDLFYPVAIMDVKSKKLSSAIYIDNTGISEDQVYLKTMVDGDLIAPIRNTFFIPKNCKTKNPIASKDGSYMYSLLCLDENGFRMKYIKMAK